ncbi:MAG: hypothetical protein FJZ56_05240 [Chlamydiae bacterium]|nr:hypothetical protein [Chlamydiota bacterium]
MAYEEYNDFIDPIDADTTRYKKSTDEKKKKTSWLDTLGGVVDVIGKGIDSYVKFKPNQVPTPTTSDPIFTPNPPKRGSGGLIIASVVGVAAIVGLIVFINKNKKP